VNTDLKNEEIKDKHFEKLKKIPDCHLEKAMKITNSIFNMDDLVEP